MLDIKVNRAKRKSAKYFEAALILAAAVTASLGL